VLRICSKGGLSCNFQHRYTPGFAKGCGVVPHLKRKSAVKRISCCSPSLSEIFYERRIPILLERTTVEIAAEIAETGGAVVGIVLTGRK